MRVKICGLRSRAEVAMAADLGAAYVGLVFFPRSPRHVTPADARWILREPFAQVTRVALTVDADDALLGEIVAAGPIDMLQLHGHEPPERVAQVRERFGLPVMKAVGVEDETDLPLLDEHARAADQILVDARPPRGAPVPGGRGIAFDWRLIRARRWTVPWMLAGGLNPQNVAEAIRLTGAEQVDVSSGVESAPGRKDRKLVAAFIDAAATAAASAA
jgi:phosphoribosylanthranilate isomerase